LCGCRLRCPTAGTTVVKDCRFLKISAPAEVQRAHQRLRVEQKVVAAAVGGLWPQPQRKQLLPVKGVVKQPYRIPVQIINPIRHRSGSEQGLTARTTSRPAHASHRAAAEAGSSKWLETMSPMLQQGTHSCVVPLDNRDAARHVLWLSAEQPRSCRTAQTSGSAHQQLHEERAPKVGGDLHGAHVLPAYCAEVAALEPVLPLPVLQGCGWCSGFRV